MPLPVGSGGASSACASKDRVEKAAITAGATMDLSKRMSSSRGGRGSQGSAAQTTDADHNSALGGTGTSSGQERGSAPGPASPAVGPSRRPGLFGVREMSLPGRVADGRARERRVFPAPSRNRRLSALLVLAVILVLLLAGNRLAALGKGLGAGLRTYRN